MNLRELRFRNATVEDIDKIMNIEVLSFPRGVRESKEVYLDRIEVFSEGFRLMEYRGEVIGYLCSELWDYTGDISRESFTLDNSIRDQHRPHGEEIYLSSLGILPEYRECGLGKLLFNHFMEYIEGRFPCLRSAVLIVSEKWGKARGIYEGAGYEKVLTIEEFFSGGGEKGNLHDALVMRKKINGPTTE